MKGRMVLPILVLLLLSVASVQAGKPEGKLVAIEHFVIEDPEMTVIGFQKVTLIIHSIEEEVFYNSMIAVITGRIYVEGELVGTVKVSLCYTGTMTGAMDADPITGRMTYSLQSTGLAEDIFGDGHWVIWYEDGESVREIGEGEIWFP